VKITPIIELIRELRKNVDLGDDIACADAARLISWLDSNAGPEWTKIFASRPWRGK
jgi:hypothetical protein